MPLPADFSTATTDPTLILDVLAWMLCVTIVLVSGWRTPPARVGLALAYVLNLTLVHFFGAAIYLVPWYGDIKNADLTVTGFTQSTVWIGCFTLGVLLAPAIGRLPGVARARSRGRGQHLSGHLPWAYLAIGLICYVILQPILARVPSFFAVASVGWNFMIVGLALGCWRACRAPSRGKLIGWLIGTACLPLLTVTAQGFLGFGTVAALSVAALVGIWYRPRWQVVLGGLLSGYVGLSLFVTYLPLRNNLRDIISSGGDTAQRLSGVYQTVAAFSWFNPLDPTHLLSIDLRLNQNLLVGASVVYMEAGNEPYALGETLWQAIEALVPRVLWPDKPVTAGSGNLVSRFTGLQYGDSTAVGIGHVLEFYANFGTAGLIFGGLLMGGLVGIVDAAAGQRLVRGDGFGVVRWYLPGISLLNVGGSMAELTSGVATAIVAVFISEWLMRYLNRVRNGREEVPAVVSKAVVRGA